jgi:hypothetical protein
MIPTRTASFPAVGESSVPTYCVESTPYARNLGNESEYLPPTGLQTTGYCHMGVSCVREGFLPGTKPVVVSLEFE